MIYVEREKNVTKQKYARIYIKCYHLGHHLYNLSFDNHIGNQLLCSVGEKDQVFKSENLR